jgi:hypothetical protein
MANGLTTEKFIVYVLPPKGKSEYPAVSLRKCRKVGRRFRTGEQIGIFRIEDITPHLGETLLRESQIIGEYRTQHPG